LDFPLGNSLRGALGLLKQAAIPNETKTFRIGDSHPTPQCPAFAPFQVAPARAFRMSLLPY